jgi:hypothetical protein
LAAGEYVFLASFPVVVVFLVVTIGCRK